MMHAAPIPATPGQPFVEPLKHEEYQPIPETVSVVHEEPSPGASVLEALTPVDRLIITKRLQVKAALSLRGKRNRFFVRTSDRNLIYTIEEDNSWWVGYFCYGLRPFQLHVNDDQGREVMRINRPFAFSARLFPCQLQNVQVFAPPGHLIGSIEQQWTVIRPVFLVKNATEDPILWIRGPNITVSCFRNVEFEMMRTDGTPVGSTCKMWQGLVHSMFLAQVTDSVGVAFEQNLNDEEKALLLASTILMEYMYYDA